MTVADAGKPHLVIAMNTIPRKSGDEYLTRTLDSLKSQIHSANAPRTDVLVFDPKGNEAGNGPFAHNKQRLSGETGIHFESKQGVKDPFKGHQEPKDPNSSDIPGSVGRQHTCDIVTQLTTVIEKWPTCDYFMFMEDDFVLCDRAMEAISHVISKSDRYSPDWSALRVSFGLNGMVVPCKDLPAMRDFMFAKSSWRPADLLAVYFVGKIAEEGAAHFGEDRRVSVYRYNIMDHIGRVSTYPGRTLGSKSGAFLKCYEMMNPWSLHVQESFDYILCSDDDLYPCDVPAVNRLPILSDFHAMPPIRKVEYHGEFFPGRQGQSCDQTCRDLGKRCDGGGIKFANSCDVIKQHFPCKMCWKSQGSDQPCYVSMMNAPPEKHPGDCMIEGLESLNRCDGKYTMTSRLCPCV